MNKTVSLLKFIIPFYFGFFAHSSFAQQSQNLSASGVIDSLITLLKTDKPDTSKVQRLNELAREISNHNPDSALILSNQALQLATYILKESGWKWNNTVIKQAAQTGIGQSYHQIAAFNEDLGKYNLSLKFYQDALNIWEQLEREIPIQYGKHNKEEIEIAKQKFKKQKAATLGNTGIVYYAQGNYSEAMKYYLQALKIDEEIENKIGVARHLSNIGNIYGTQGEYSKALVLAALCAAKSKRSRT